MFWERRNYFYLLIDFSPPICKVIHLTWCALLSWKPLGWSENYCWASSAGCRCNYVNEWEMALGFLQSLGIVGWRMKLEVFSLITFFVFLPLSLSEGHCLTWLGWNTLPAWSENTLPPHHPARGNWLEKVGLDVCASRGTERWGAISTTNLAESLLRIKEWSPRSREDQSAGI